jgi:hypothetical protein
LRGPALDKQVGRSARSVDCRHRNVGDIAHASAGAIRSGRTASITAGATGADRVIDHVGQQIERDCHAHDRTRCAAAAPSLARARSTAATSAAAASLKAVLVKHLDELCRLDHDKLVEQRYAKYRAIGAWAGAGAA